MNTDAYIKVKEMEINSQTKAKRTFANFFTKIVSSKEKKVLISVSAILFLMSAIIYFSARLLPSEFTEKYFSLGVYPVWVNTMSVFTRYLPFSLAEFIIITLIILIPTYTVILIVDMVKAKSNCFKVLGSFILRAITIVSVFAFLLVMGAGANYFRYEFARYSNLYVRESSADELYALCNELVEKANVLREDIPADKNGGATYKPMSNWEMSKEINRAYQKMNSENPIYQKLFWLSEKIPVKSVYFSEAMSYLQLAGTITPFTLEANVNVHTTQFDIPASMAHELAHISGFMREDEANFIAYLACTSSENKFLNYSGVMSALVYSTNALYKSNADLHREVMMKCSDKVSKDLQLDREYYDAHISTAGKIYTSANDTFLKINAQKDGVKSYGRMVDLLLADYRKRHNTD